MRCVINFTDILTDYHIPFHESGKNTRRGWVNFMCPYCQKDPYMGFNVEGRYVNCWACGRHPLWETLHIITREPPPVVWGWIKEIPETFILPEMKPVGKLKVPIGVEPMGELHQEYLHDRRLNASRVARDWQVQGISGFGGHLRYRLFIPIHLRGQVVSWTTRSITKREPRYWAAKDDESSIPIERLLYGVDGCRNGIIVVEGPVDVWAIGPGAVATLGTRVSPAQLAQLSSFPVRVVCFDSEPDAQARARKLANDLSVFEGVTHNVVLETGKDAASASKDEVKALKKEFLLWSL